MLRLLLVCNGDLFLSVPLCDEEEARFQYIISILIELFLLRPFATEAPHVLRNIYSDLGEGGRHSDIANRSINHMAAFHTRSGILFPL